jgi:hypothetical protein
LRLHLAMQIDEDTHLSLRTEVRVIGSVPLEKTYRRSLSVQSHDQTARTSPSTFPFLPSSQCQRADPLGRVAKTSVEAELPNFWEQEVLSGLPGSTSALSGFRFVAARRRRLHQRWAGYMAGHLGCQHPKMTKSTFLEEGPETGALSPPDTPFGRAVVFKWCTHPRPARGEAPLAQFRLNVWRLPASPACRAQGSWLLTCAGLGANPAAPRELGASPPEA